MTNPFIVCKHFLDSSVIETVRNWLLHSPIYPCGQDKVIEGAGATATPNLSNDPLIIIRCQN